MNVNRTVEAASILLCLGLLFWAGCANFLQPERGAVARPEARIALPENGVQRQTFEAGDVKIIYSLSGPGERFALSGTLVFAQSLTYSFPIITSFTVKMSFLDGAGRVLETIDITPVYPAFGAVEKVDFRVSREAPPGSRAIAFNYFGVFRSYPADDDGSWEIFYFPYD